MNKKKKESMKKIFRNIMTLMTDSFHADDLGMRINGRYQCGSNPYEYC